MKFPPISLYTYKHRPFHPSLGLIIITVCIFVFSTPV